MKKKICVVTNSHMDPIWLWRLREGRSTWVNTCRTVVRMAGSVWWFATAWALRMCGFMRAGAWRRSSRQSDLNHRGLF